MELSVLTRIGLRNSISVDGLSIEEKEKLYLVYDKIYNNISSSVYKVIVCK